MSNASRRFKLLPYWRRRRWIKLSVAVSSGGLILFFVHTLAAPAHGRVIRGPVPSVLSSSAPVKSTVPATPLANQYFSLTLPAGYVLQPNVSQPANLLTTATILKPSRDGTLIIAVGLSKLDGDITADPGYQSRLQKTDQYQTQPLIIRGEHLTAIIDRQTSATVVYWPHAGLLATVSASSGLADPDNDDGQALLAALQPLLDSWQWAT